MTPDISAVIVSYNTRDLLREALSSIVESAPDARLVVVDNGSVDGSPAMVREAFPGARLIEPGRNLGFAAASNLGLRHATERFALLLNPDARLRACALQRLVAALEARPDAAVAGPRLEFPNGRLQSCGFAFPTLGAELRESRSIRRLWPAPAPQRIEPGDVADVDWVDGACMLVRRDAIASVGMFDEQYFLYGEEVDWQYRMRQRGWRVLAVPDAVVVHHLAQSSGVAHPATLRRLVDSRLRFFRTHHGLPTAVLVSVVLTLGFVKQMLDAFAIRSDGGAEAPRVKLSAVAGWWRSVFGPAGRDAR